MLVHIISDRLSNQFLVENLPELLRQASAKAHEDIDWDKYVFKINGTEIESNHIFSEADKNAEGMVIVRAVVSKVDAGI